MDNNTQYTVRTTEEYYGGEVFIKVELVSSVLDKDGKPVSVYGRVRHYKDIPDLIKVGERALAHPLAQC